VNYDGVLRCDGHALTRCAAHGVLGEALSVQQLKHETTIKRLRATAKETDATVARLQEQLTATQQTVAQQQEELQAAARMQGAHRGSS
jgi:hypothetical protein